MSPLTGYPRLAYLTTTTVAILLSISTHHLTSGQTSSCQKVTTFNAGLTPRIENYDTRKRDVPPALLAEDADVICLQEYWFEDDIASLLETVSSKYKYHYSEIHSSVGTLARNRRKRWFPKMPCSPGDVLYFYLRVIPCATINNCLPEFGISLQKGLACVASKCSAVLKGSKFNENCFSCVSLSATSIAGLMTSCTPRLGTYDNRLNAAGLVLLSQREITKASFKEFFPGRRMTIQRGYIEAEVKDLGTVICSHLSSVFADYFEYDLPFSSYKEQQQAEVGILQENYGSRDHLLAADFNTGPQVEAAANPEAVLSGEAPENFQQLLGLGYSTTYLSDDGRCTYCRRNSLVDYSNNVIDYVMLKGSSYSSAGSQRTLVTSPPLSDHYGVRTTVCRNNTP